MINFFKKKYNQHKEVANNFAWRSLQIFGKQGIIFIIFIICAKLLSRYDFGIYNYALAVIFFLVMFGDFGISTAASKYVAEYNLTDKSKLKAVLFNSGLIILGITVFIAILNYYFGDYFLKDKSVYVLYLLPLLFFAPMTSLYDGIYRGLKRFKQLAILTSIVGLISTFLVFFFINNYGLRGALIFQDIFYGALFLVLAIGYGEFEVKFDKSVLREVGLYSFIYGVAVFGNYLFNRFGILIMGHYGYINEIATYQLLDKFFLVLVLPFTMLGQVVAPNFTEMIVRKEYSKIHSKLQSYTYVFILAGLTLGTVAYVLTPSIVKLFFNNYYNELFFQILPFSIIILITNIWAATIDAGILIPSGFAGLMAKFYTVLGIVSCVLGWWLTVKIGYMGVVYSFAISNIVMVLGLRFFFFRKIYHLKNNLILR